MGVHMERSANASKSCGKAKKIPGSTVTQDQIDDQRRERKLRQRKPPVPKQNHVKRNVSNDTLNTAASRAQISMRSECLINSSAGGIQSSRVLQKKFGSQDKFSSQRQPRQTWQSSKILIQQKEQTQTQKYLHMKHNSFHDGADGATARTEDEEGQPAPRQTRPPSPCRFDDSRRDVSPSIQEFYKDAEFVEFLKQIKLFV